MIDYVITNGSQYYPDKDQPSRSLFDSAVKEYQKIHQISDEDMKKIQIVGAKCYVIEPLHQIVKQLEIMVRANFDMIVIALSLDSKAEKGQRQTIHEFFTLHREYENMDIYSGRIVYAKIPQK